MARITVEDCLSTVNNRFELVLIAAKRARQLMRGSADPCVPWENDKATVVALREVAAGHTVFVDRRTEQEKELSALANSLPGSSTTPPAPPATAQDTFPLPGRPSGG